MKKFLISSMLFIFLFTSKSFTQEGYQSGDHETLVFPTALTMEKGKFYFTSYELALLNFTGAPTPTTHVGVFTLFPIMTTFLETASLGVKQRIPISDKFNVAGILSYTPKAEFLTFGGVATYGKRDEHYSIGFIGFKTFVNDDFFFSEEDDVDYLVYFSGAYDVSKRITLLAETSFLAGVDNSLILGIGVRFRYEDLSWEIGGIRPLMGDLGDLILIPMIKANFVF